MGILTRFTLEDRMLKGFLEFKKLSTLLKEKDLHSFIRKTLEMQSPA